MPVNVDYTAYKKAHAQPFDVNAQAPTEDDWRLYNAAHADPAAVPIESIQASPANIVEATAAAHTVDTLPEPTSSAHASVRLANEPQPEEHPTATALRSHCTRFGISDSRSRTIPQQATAPISKPSISPPQG